MRRSCIAELYLVGGALVFLSGVGLVVWAQSQEAINATLFERLNGIVFRLDRLETLLNAALIAMVANFVAHVIQIRTQLDDQQRDRRLRERKP